MSGDPELWTDAERARSVMRDKARHERVVNSWQAIADQLKISVGTVKVHRKNIHNRLNTSTQAEIFTQFITHLNNLDES